MIKVDDLKKLVKLVLLSGHIKNVKPLSLLVVAKPGSGKTEIIMSYTNSSLTFNTDLNYSALIEKLRANKGIKHIIIPDFVKITMKKSSTSKNLISLFNSCTEEGMFKIDGYFKHDFKGRKVGLITSITPGSLGQVKTEWGNIGFIDRMIKCSYSYSKKTIAEIMKSVSKEEEYTIKSEKLKFPLKKSKGGFDIKNNSKFNDQFIELSKDNVRKQKRYQILLKCNALNEGRLEVNQKDVEEIKRLNKYMNFDKKEI